MRLEIRLRELGGGGLPAVWVARTCLWVNRSLLTQSSQKSVVEQEPQRDDKTLDEKERAALIANESHLLSSLSGEFTGAEGLIKL